MMSHMSKAYNTMSIEPLVPVVKALEDLKITWDEAVQIAAGNATVATA
jgi:hypothetical protein